MLDSIGPRALGIGATAHGSSMVRIDARRLGSVMRPAVERVSIGQIGGYGQAHRTSRPGVVRQRAHPHGRARADRPGRPSSLGPRRAGVEGMRRGRSRRRHRPDDHRLVPDLRPAGRPRPAQGSLQQWRVRRDARDLEPWLGPGRRRRRDRPGRRSTGCAPTRGSSASSRPCRVSRGTGNSAPNQA